MEKETEKMVQEINKASKEFITFLDDLNRDFVKEFTDMASHVSEAQPFNGVERLGSFVDLFNIAYNKVGSLYRSRLLTIISKH